MLNVFITVDTEVWCGSWKNLDRRFPQAFQNYVYGNTPNGDYGIPFQLRILSDFGLNAVFFVEPLFSGRFGRRYLTEIVDLIKDADQDIQLHLHTEWVDESLEDILKYRLKKKKQHMRHFSEQDQEMLIRKGMDWLKEAGVKSVNAFRAGSFGMNKHTLTAARKAGVEYDSSYNETLSVNSGMDSEQLIDGPVELNGVIEYPMTVYEDWPGHLRHAQLTACSFKELEGLLWQSAELEKDSFVLLSHNFELFDPATMKPNKINIKRFEKLCNFLDKHRDTFNTTDFENLDGNPPSDINTDPLKSPIWKTGLRMAEQVVSKVG